MGRVLTLVESFSSQVYGVAYKIKSNSLSETFENLNLREKCGYSLKQVIFHSHHDQYKTKPFRCVCYFANDDNFYYSSELDLNLLAQQIFKSVGPSGSNKSYLYNVCDALRKLAHDTDSKKSDEYLKNDEHIFQLEMIVKKLDK
jgi:cation transport protein ChaC